jgi:hypothetical protein
VPAWCVEMGASQPATVSIAADSVIDPLIDVPRAVTNLDSAREGGLLKLLDFQDHWLESFLAGAKLELRDLEQLGREAQRYPCNENPRLPNTKYATNQATETMPRFALGDLEVDGTVRYSDGEEHDRMLRGPSWANNCCAFTVAFMCALWSNLGRKVCDQLPQSRLRELSEPARLVRYVIAREWSSQTLAQRNGYRDVLIKCLEKYEPQTWGGLAKGEFAPALPLIKLFYEGAPQMTYTSLYGYRCCDDVWSYQNGTNPRSQIGINSIPKGRDFADAINKQLAGRVKTSSSVCSRGDKCTKQRRRTPLILDRLPPSLVVKCPHKSMEAAVAGGAFKELGIIYTDKHGSKVTVRYRPYLAVYLAKSHFHARVNRGGEIWEHDGFHGGEAYSVGGWIVPDAKMVLVQYEQASEALRSDLDSDSS